jgi:exonuclease III
LAQFRWPCFPFDLEAVLPEFLAIETLSTNFPGQIQPAGTPIRILAWNICHGGGSRLTRIFEMIGCHAPDILVLSEYCYGERGVALEEALRGHGYPCFAVCPQGPGQDDHGVLVASRKPFVAEYFSGQIIHPTEGDFSHRLVHARFADFDVIGAYVPLCAGKEAVFDLLLQRTHEFLSRPTLLIGDINTALSPADVQGNRIPCDEKLAELLDKKWIDAWRSRHMSDGEYTWVHSSSENGFRLDQALVSESFDRRITAVRYSHAERDSHVSDHSALLVDLV